MRLSVFAARVRRPMTLTASVAAAVAVSLPVSVPARVQPHVVRVVATPKPVVAFTPVRLKIPKIDIEAPIVPVLTLADGTMGSPINATDVGWWPGREPGKGNALFDSHHDWNGATGSFYLLETMKPGDQVIVYGKDPQDVLTYSVTWVKQVNGGIDATDILGNGNGEQIVTLITCGGAFNTLTRHHVDRIVVRATLSA